MPAKEQTKNQSWQFHMSETCWSLRRTGTCILFIYCLQKPLVNMFPVVVFSVYFTTINNHNNQPRLFGRALLTFTLFTQIGQRKTQNHNALVTQRIYKSFLSNFIRVSIYLYRNTLRWQNIIKALFLESISMLNCNNSKSFLVMGVSTSGG